MPTLINDSFYIPNAADIVAVTYHTIEGRWPLTVQGDGIYFADGTKTSWANHSNSEKSDGEWDLIISFKNLRQISFHWEEEPESEIPSKKLSGVLLKPDAIKSAHSVPNGSQVTLPGSHGIFVGLTPRELAKHGESRSRAMA